jgi:hypothetical protein
MSSIKEREERRATKDFRVFLYGLAQKRRNRRSFVEAKKKRAMNRAK